MLLWKRTITTFAHIKSPHLGVQPKTEIKKIDVLKPFFHDQDAIQIATSSSSEAKIKDVQDVSGLKMEPVNPKIVFREKMRALRRSYLKEAKERRIKAQQMEELKEQQQRAEYERFKADVARFRQEQAQRMTDIAFDADMDAKSTEELSQEQQAAKARDQELWNKEKRARYERKLQAMEQESQERLGRLLQLFHESKDFITYSNLDFKLERAFMAARGNSVTVSQMMANMERRSSDDVAIKREKELKNIMQMNEKTPDVHHIQDALEESRLASVNVQDLEQSVKELEQMQLKQQEELQKKLE